MPTATTIPASVRHKNAGAMGLGGSAMLFGATKVSVLNDGFGNTIATFPTMVDGAGAMFHLLRTGSYYGMTIWTALYRWGGGEALAKAGKAQLARERTDEYAASIERHSRFRRDDKITAEWLEDPVKAIEFGKAMARHEAGQEYPMTDAQWDEAHAEFMTVMAGGHILLDRVKPEPVMGPFELARSYLGEREIPGSRHNDFIVGCFEDIGSTYRSDETAWCAAFLGAMLKAAGCAYISGDAGCGARNYKEYGHALDEPEEGCIVVFWRESPRSWKGHVAFVESFTATTLTIIGGNQSNAVTRMTVPRTGPKSQVLGYRRPVSNVTPAKEIIKDESMQRKIVGIGGAVTALATLLWNGISAVATFVGDFIGILPETATSATTAVATGQQVAAAAGIQWLPVMGLMLVLIAFGFGAYATWKRLRPASGALTKPPYETDPTPPADDVKDGFFSFEPTEAVA